MNLSRSSQCLALLFGLALAAIPSRSAHAADFHVSPVRFDLGKKQRTALLTISNTSAEPLRLQVSMHVWSQDAQNPQALTPTQDLTYYPSLLTVEPGQARNIRIGGQLQPADTEKSYRLLVTQLPPTAQPANAMELRVLTQMSIPVFVEAEQSAPHGTVEEVALNRGELSFLLHNTGNIHFFAKKARIQGRDARGALLFDKEQSGWYVLPGVKQRFKVPVPPPLCARLHSVSVEVSTDAGVTPTSATLSGNSCGS